MHGEMFTHPEASAYPGTAPLALSMKQTVRIYSHATWHFAAFLAGLASMEPEIDCKLQSNYS
jgi:hypothetical protein